MRIRELGYKGKTAVLAGIAGSVTATSEVAGADWNEGSLLDTANWLGKAGLIWAGFRVANIGVARMRENIDRSNEEKWLEVMSRLPDLKDPISPSGIDGAVQERLKRKSHPIGLLTAFSATRHAADTGVAEDEYLTYYALAEDVNYVIDQMVEAIGTPNAGPDDFRYLLAHNAALLLDEVAPIREDCTKTPQTSDPGKYWFDYIQHEAFDRAGLLFEQQA